jgi:beta-mannosidase
MDDVRDFYVRELFGVDPLMERYVDAERALDLGRAANAEMVEAVFSEWRRPGSGCAGGLLAALRDLRPGAGWGMLDSFGRPKSTWYALRRVSQPVALLLSDERFNGLNLYVVNDTTEPIFGSIRVTLFARGEQRVEEASQNVKVDARSGVVVEAGSLFDGFRDISYAYRFAPPAQDVVVASLLDEAGNLVSEVVHLPLGRGRPLEGDLGLAATAHCSAAGAWRLDVTSRRFAQFVVVDVPDFIADNSWFHLPPGATRSVNLTPVASAIQPQGYVSALNSRAVASISVEGER